jgi:hypothetical protein
MEFGMLWRKGQKGDSERVCPAIITNVSLGGVQMKTRMPIEPSQELTLELAGESGPVFLPGDVRYAKNGSADGIHTLGFRFKPETSKDREELAKFVLSLRERISVSG